MMSLSLRQQQRWLLKPAVFALSLLPLALLLEALLDNALGPNPVETVLHTTGDWALRFLLITLAMTPLRRFTGQGVWLRLRRMLGLFCFFYASLHFLTWLGLDREFAWSGVAEDVIKRPYVTLGFLAFILLVPLAATSTKGMMRHLGAVWRKLHRLIYLIGVLGVAHFLWLVKADLAEPLLYGAILVALLVARLDNNPLLSGARYLTALFQGRFAGKASLKADRWS